jgi:trigger factor
MATKHTTHFKIKGLEQDLSCSFNEVKSEKLYRSVEVNVSAKDVLAAIELVTKEYAKDVKVKGFRPGKVPVEMVKQQHMTSIMSDAAKSLVKYSSHEVTHEKYKIAGEIDIDIKEFSIDKGLTYHINFEVFPDFEIPKFEKVKISNYVFDLKAKDLEKSLSDIASSYKDFVKAEGKTKAKIGDALLIDFIGKFDGVAFEGGTGKGHRLELGSKSFIDNFEEQLVGSKVGDKKTIKVRFPDEYHSKAHAGKEAEFEVVVHEVLHSSPAQINDEFAKKFGMKDLAELKEKLEKQLSENYSNATYTLTKKSLFDELEKLCKFDCPENIFKAELEAIKSRFTSESEYKSDDIENMAKRRVKLGMLLAAVAEDNRLTISNSDIQQELLKITKQYPGQEKQIVDYYQKNPQAVNNLRGPILEEKAVKFILENVTKNDKKVTVDELVKLSEEN